MNSFNVHYACIYSTVLIIRCIFSLCSITAQETAGDSVVFDTVYIVKDPVVINKTIYDTIVEVDSSDFLENKELESLDSLQTPQKEKTVKKKTWRWSIGPLISRSYSSMSFMSDSAVMPFTVNHQKPEYGVGLTISARLKISSFSYGLDISGQMYNTAFSDKHSWLFKINSTEVTVTDTLDVYYIIRDNDTTPRYVTGHRTIIQTDSNHIEKSYKSHVRWQVIKLGFTMGYHFREGRWENVVRAGFFAKYAKAHVLVHSEDPYYDMSIASEGISFGIQPNIKTILWQRNDKFGMFLSPYLCLQNSKYIGSETDSWNIKLNSYGLALGIIF